MGNNRSRDLSVNGPCVWTMSDEEKKIFGTPDEDEFILDIGFGIARSNLSAQK